MRRRWPAHTHGQRVPKGKPPERVRGKVTQGNRAEVAGRSCWGERPLAARSCRGGGRWPLTQPPISAHGPPSQPTVRWFEPKKAKSCESVVALFPGPSLPNSCQIPSPPLPRPLILLSLPPPDSNSPTCLKVPSAQHTAFVFPRGALPGPSDTEPGTPGFGCQESLGVHKVMTWELLPLFFLPLIPTLIPASGDSRCTHVPHTLSAGERGEGWTRWG